MAVTLRDLTREFGLAEVSLEALRVAARTEPVDRRLADAILRLIAEWESGGRTDSAWSRNELRARIRKLVPTAVADKTASAARRDPTETMYNAGLRGQRRHD